jgi:ribosomal protein S18 acetylase RimI-like enzyme
LAIRAGSARAPRLVRGCRPTAACYGARVPFDDIRPIRRDDLDAIYEICLRTSDAGNDATALHDDPLLPGHVWAAPYVVHAPEHGFVFVGDDDRPIGYVLGAVDSRSFEDVLEREWWPALRTQYPLGVERRPADRAMVEFIHRPPVARDEVVTAFPSHLHIDLLPDAQGRGAGRRLIDVLTASLAAAGSTGVHLGVDGRNERAMGFYTALGFTRLQRDEHVAIFGKPLR